MNLRVLIVEDDSLAADLLGGLLRLHPDVEVVAVLADFAAARARLAEPGYDLVFLDIELAAQSGFDLVPHVSSQARVVFLTGHRDHALRAFEVDALDYIVKPITAARLEVALQRARVARRRAAEGDAAAERDGQIFLRGPNLGGTFTALDRIAVVRSSENYSEVILISGERSIVRRTMHAWAALLPDGPFVRVHRTAIVNFHCVQRIVREPDESTHLLLRGLAHPVPVSRRYWSGLRVKLAGAGLLGIQRH